MNGINIAERNAAKEMNVRISALVEKHFDQNLYAAGTRKRIIEDIAAIRDELLERHNVSMPIVALYVADYGRTLKVKFYAPTLLKGIGCVGWMKEPQGGDIMQLRVENTGGPRN